ncbi:Cortactin-binding protein 2, partial [Bienertia sinuspersici]
MSSFLSKPPHKWGPFGPPVDALNTSSSIPGSTPSSSNSIWKTTPAIATTKPATSKPSAATPKPPSTTKPLAATTKPPTTTKPPITTKPPLATTKPPATTNSPCNNTYEDMQQTIRNAQNTGRQTTEQQTSEQQISGDFGNNRSDKPKPTKSRLPFSVNGWPTDVVYDAKEEVATIDANGKVELVSGPIQPIDVLSSNGRRYFVEFNELHQPLRKGGHILVKFLGYIAKMGNYCPLGALTWRNVENKLKFDILKKMREHFIIPNDEVYDKLALQRVDKYWRHYKHELKKTFFHPDKKTIEQHYDPVPSGHTSNDWIKLVNYWFSPKGQKLSEIGKEARSLQCQTHIMGANSYANMRADYEDEHGKPMGLIEAWERSHMRKDGSFVEGTATEDFLHDTKAKVETLKLSAPSTSCKEDLEDKAFHDVMNGGKIPERPQGFGFGIKRSDVYGVRGLVRKEGYSKGKMKFVELDLNSNSSPCNKKEEDLEKQNEELSMKYNENNNLLKTVVTQFSEFLDVMRNGNASVQLIDAAQSTLAMATQQ